MKIRKYVDFLNEELNDTPESYVEIALKQIKRKIDKMFEFQENEEQPEDQPMSEEDDNSKSVKRAKAESKDRSKMSLKDLGVRLESSEISKYSKMYDNLTVKFSDDDATYNLYIAIDLKEALPKDATKDFSYKDIEKCYIKFKKYDLDTFEVIGQITKNVEIKKIDEDFLIDLKIEMDDEFGDEEEFKIETE
jgi:arginyl-tRNA synthetase